MKTLRIELVASGLLLAWLQTLAATRYVNPDNSSPTLPYTSWNAAATNIQDAVDAAFVGSTVLVSNGVYAVGGRTVGASSTNRLVVTPRVNVESLNGAAVTAIEGYQIPGTTNGESAVRCVWLAAEPC